MTRGKDIFFSQLREKVDGVEVRQPEHGLRLRLVGMKEGALRSVGGGCTKIVN